MNCKRIGQNVGAAGYKTVLYSLVITLLTHASVCGAQDSSAAYNDTENNTNDSSGYSDSTPHKKHIYDTSRNFFNLKDNTGDPYTIKKIPSRISAAAEVNKLKEEDDFWYVKSIEKFKASPVEVVYNKKYTDSLAKRDKADINTQQFSEEDSAGLQLPAWANWIIWGIIVTIFLFAVAYFLIANKINIFSRSIAGGEAAAGDEAIDLFTIPYGELLQKAYAEKNYRLAVRILYLQTLKMLSEQNIIHFKADYTNMNYMEQLSHTMFYSDFSAITRHYEYVWYGGFAVSEQAFTTIRNDFASIQHKVLHR